MLGKVSILIGLVNFVGDCTLIEYAETSDTGVTTRRNILIDFGSKPYYLPPDPDEDVCAILRGKFRQPDTTYHVDWLFLTHPDGVYC